MLAQGTMEEKIYQRQVTKQSLALRVIDEHQLDRHFTRAELAELYRFYPDIYDEDDVSARPLPILPTDDILADLLHSLKKYIVTYHEHDSLLVNKIEEMLTEEERAIAWTEYQKEKAGDRQREKIMAQLMKNYDGVATIVGGGLPANDSGDDYYNDDDSDDEINPFWHFSRSRDTNL